MAQVKLIIARHGNTFNKGDVILRIGSRTDLPLTEEGCLQGIKLGNNLKQANLIPTNVYVAPLKRTLETAKYAVKVFNPNIPINIVNFLSELDYGEFDGLPEYEVIQKLGEIEKSSGQKNTNLIDRETLGKEVLESWDKNMILPKGWHFLKARVNTLEQEWKGFATELTNLSKESTNLVVTSNGIARFALSILPHNHEKPKSLKLSTGAYSLFVWENGNWRLESWNVR